MPLGMFSFLFFGVVSTGSILPGVYAFLHRFFELNFNTLEFLTFLGCLLFFSPPYLVYSALFNKLLPIVVLFFGDCNKIRTPWESLPKEYTFLLAAYHNTYFWGQNLLNPLSGDKGQRLYCWLLVYW